MNSRLVLALLLLAMSMFFSVLLMHGAWVFARVFALCAAAMALLYLTTSAASRTKCGSVTAVGVLLASVALGILNFL